MAKKPKITKELSEKKIKELEEQIKARKKELLNGLLASIARPGGLNDLESVNAALDAAGKQEEALNRVRATIGLVMLQKAKRNKAKRLGLPEPDGDV